MVFGVELIALNALLIGAYGSVMLFSKKRDGSQALSKSN